MLDETRLADLLDELVDTETNARGCLLSLP